MRATICVVAVYLPAPWNAVILSTGDAVVVLVVFHAVDEVRVLRLCCLYDVESVVLNGVATQYSIRQLFPVLCVLRQHGCYGNLLSTVLAIHSMCTIDMVHLHKSVPCLIIPYC